MNKKRHLVYRQIGDKKQGEQDKEEIQDSLDKKERGKGRSYFWAGVLTGAPIMALAVLFSSRCICSGYILQAERRSTQSSLQVVGKWCPGITEGEKATKPIRKKYFKMQMIQSIIDQVFLYDEDATEVEDYILRGHDGRFK